MYLAVDVGGTKTFVTAVSDDGQIKEQFRFATDKDYQQFLAELSKSVDNLATRDFKAACIALPARLDREKGKLLNLHNLPWINEYVKHDCEKIFNCPTLIENDANLAGLSEAMLHKEAETVLYITVSTGIGTGVVRRQRLDPTLLDAEGGQMQIPYHGKLANWESFASGRAFYARYHKFGSDIPASNVAIWKSFAKNLAVGVFELVTVIQPDLIIIGGSMGTHFNKYASHLKAELKKYELPIIKIPKIVEAERPEEAVIYGCYDLARQTYGSTG